MILKINSATFKGISGIIVDVEISISNGLPNFNIVGLPDASVKESKERVRAAIINSGFIFPMKRITVNLAPADIKKEGSIFDLPIAIAILVATKQIVVKDIEKFLFLGELSLFGELRKIKGALPIVIDAINHDIFKFVIPLDNTEECAILDKAKIFPFENLNQVVEFLKYQDSLPYKKQNTKDEDYDTYKVDFSDVVGQESCKRAIEVAAAGGHNILMFGPPGCGKSMIAKRISTILPKLSYEEALEVTKIYSISGSLDKDESLIKKRPFRNPHHTSSQISLVGGGNKLMPGEISLAHNGVLFLDEILEFKKKTLEVLRQPLEDRYIKINRFNGSVKYPANFMLVGAMNPCPCGYQGSGVRECICTEYEKKRYINKLSGPLLDRIDMFTYVTPVPYKKFRAKNNSESSIEIRKRVERAREIQKERLKQYGIYSNAQMDQRLINKYCNVDFDSRRVMEKIYEKYKLSARSYNRILKVARTIADLNSKKSIGKNDIIEALQYRKFINKNII